MTPGERVARQAARYLGVTEVPPGSNRGPDVDRWQRPWGMGYGWPWCGAYVAAMYAEAGVDDRGLAHPSTAIMYERAKASGSIIPRPMPGAIILWPGTHTGVCADYSPDGRTVVTYEGNAGDAVRQRVRAFGPGTGVVFTAPTGVRNTPADKPTRARRYYIEDPAAVPVFRGPWRSKAARDRAVARLPRHRRDVVRRVRTPRGFGFYEGPRRVYGPWATQAARDDAARVLARRLGRPVRRYSEAVTARPAILTPDDLGKTT